MSTDKTKSFLEIKSDFAKVRVKINAKTIEAIKTKLERAKYVDLVAEEVAKKIHTRACNLRNEAIKECEQLGHLDQYTYTDTEEGWDPHVGIYPISSSQIRFCRICGKELFK